MSSNIISKLTFATIGVGALLLALAPDAHQPVRAQECGDLPNVDWWTNTHAEVEKLVVENYGGKWQNYIARWHKYRESMDKIYQNKGVAEVKSRGIELRDELLQKHIVDIDTRIEVLECLKSRAVGSDPTAFEKPQAEKNPRPTHLNDAVAKSTISDGKLSVAVAATCDADTVEFKITNQGAKWPRLGEIKLHRTDNNKVLAARNMRLTETQQVIFRVGGKRLQDATEVGLFINPSWYERPFKFDSVLNCRR